MPSVRREGGQLDRSPIDLTTLSRHGLDGQQLMSSREELAEKLLRILVCLSHHSLLHQADIAGDVGDHFSLPARDRGDDGVGESER